MSSASKQAFATRAIHHGYDPQQYHGALCPPVFMSSTFTFPSAEYGGACFAGTEPGYFYSRIANPTLNLLEQRIANLEGGEAAVAFSSGMGAVTACCWTLLGPGDELIVDETLYGCTFSYFHHGLERFGVKVTHVDMTQPEALAAAIGPRTRLVYCETPANPNMRLVDIAAVAAITHRHAALLLVDNTYCTPYLQRPLALGADIVLHSATKYLGGHGDLLAGVVVTRAELAQHPAVERVYYPGLPAFRQYQLAQRQMARPGGMIAFELKGGMAAGIRFLNALQLILRAVSLGDCESLAEHPASMTHSAYSEEERHRHHISDGLIRLSAGLEDADDLLADIEQALAQA